MAVRAVVLLLVNLSNRMESQVGLAIPWFVMMKRGTVPIADVYVPTKRRGTLEPKRVDEIAAERMTERLQRRIASPMEHLPEGQCGPLSNRRRQVESACTFLSPHDLRVEWSTLPRCRSVLDRSRRGGGRRSRPRW